MLSLSVTVGAAIPVTRPARKHLRPDRQALEAYIATSLRRRRFISNSTGLEVMVAGAGEDTGLAQERRRLAVPAEEVVP